MGLTLLAASVTFSFLEIVLFVGLYEGGGGQDNDFGAAVAMFFCLAALAFFLIAAVAVGRFTHYRVTSRIGSK